MSKLKKNLFYWAGATSFLFFIFAVSGFKVGGNFNYGLPIYIFGAYLVKPFVLKEPMLAPYSGDVLTPKKDSFIRTVLFLVHMVITIIGLAVMF